MVYSGTEDRREGRRYLVVGKGTVTSLSGQEFSAELVNIGPGGMLAFCDGAPPLGEQVNLRFTIEGYPLEVQLVGRVVHTAVGLLGVAFLEEPEALDEVLLWLEANFLSCLL
jgi:hypothetical protein